MTEWNQFRALDMKRVKGLMRSPRIADLRNIYEPGAMRDLGFSYVAVGRRAEPGPDPRAETLVDEESEKLVLA
ncbi:MAG TPA: hypothetical protein VER08_10795, partial [Pyrinomonadaceae bacterium]|nr:hypothetical protein [Pyrinomonadaceae bacterium]